MSASINKLDALMLSHVTHQWRKMARIVGGTIQELTPTQIAELHESYPPPLDLVFAERLKHLAEQGKLEWQGDLTTMRFCELRLPDAS